MVEFNTFSTTELSNYLHNFFLLFGPKHVFAIIHSIVNAHSATEVSANSSSSLSHKISWNVFIKSLKSPSLLD